MTLHEIPLGTYRVSVASGGIDDVGAHAERILPRHRAAIITDENVQPLYGARTVASFGDAAGVAGEGVPVFVMPAGEGHKTREQWARLTDALLAAGFGRDTVLVALGGGVVGDVTGFVAATYMRGVPYVQVPTTLLSMIDASVGGKTGLDTPAGKNLVGAFHQPSAVIADPATLNTLPRRHLRGGFAEALKHGVIASERYFARVAALIPPLLADALPGTHDEMPGLIARSVRIKAEIVRQDERERGVRRVLNFGHTLGHAIEAASDYQLLHGEAVAIGMALEARLAERAGIAAAGTAAAIIAALERAQLPVRPPPGLDPERILLATRSDKKAAGGEVRYALPLRIGAMAGENEGWALPVAEELVRDVLA